MAAYPLYYFELNAVSSCTLELYDLSKTASLDIFRRILLTDTFDGYF